MSEDNGVYDLDRVIAERDTAAPFRFRFGGETFEFAAGVDIRVVAKFTSGDPLGALEGLLGPEQFARFDAIPTTFDDKAFRDLLDRYSKHLGVDRGE